MNYLNLESELNLKLVSQKTKLIFRFAAVVIVLLALGMQLQFVIIPTLSTYKFWLAIGAFFLLFMASY